MTSLRRGPLCRAREEALCADHERKHSMPNTLLTMGGELSKREGVLFHWWPFSSKRNDELQLFYRDISLI